MGIANQPNINTMEASLFNYNHSLKNIPIPPKTSYMKSLIARTEEFIERVRWKTFFFLNPSQKPIESKNFGFRTSRTAPQSKELLNFETDLYNLIANIKFDDRREPFQRELEKAVCAINKSDKLFVMADKTNNIYQVSLDHYKKLLLDTTTKDYKQVPRSTMDEINQEAKHIAEELNLSDRMEQFSEGKAFITIKDHKEDFRRNPKFRLINPAKSDIGKVSKQILQKINQDIKEATNLNQWQSTAAVLDWFKTIKDKPRKRFLQLDIVEFYPSISEPLLEAALNFARTHTDVSDVETHIIKHSRKALLFSHPHTDPNGDSIPWTKKDGLFDVTMGAPDGAEVCELIGLFMLDLVRRNFKDLNFGLYRDDGLAVHRRIPGPKLDRMRKDLVELFKQHGLSITINLNLTSADFLDITLDLAQEKFLPYKKPNNKPLYVHAASNHPPSVIKQIPLSINKRLSSIASNEEDFNHATPEYQEALRNSAHQHILVYQPGEVEGNLSRATAPNAEKKKRRRNVLWYNPPFNKSVKTRIGKQFLALISKHFPKKSPLRPILNRNNVKLSYSCTKNIKALMSSHNQRLIQRAGAKKTPDAGKRCNCRKKEDCPLQNVCQQSAVYKATILDGEGEGKYYIGSSINFKNRYRCHKQSFRQESQKNATTLSHLVWETGTNPDPNIKWEIIQQAPAYRKGGKDCELCLTEKLHILRNYSNTNLLNKKTDIALKCKHKSRYRLSTL